MLLFTIIGFINFGFFLMVTSLYCSNIRESGSSFKFSIQVLQQLSDEDLTSCLVFLGKDPLGRNEGKYIWEKLIKIYDGVANIPENDLQQLGWIAQAIPVKDFANITFDNIDIIAAFGQYHNLSQVQVLAEKVREDWSSKEPTDYTFYDLMALKHVLCGFNKTVVEMIHPDSYKEAASVLATLQGCSRDSLEALAGLAKSEDAFGDPSTWHSSQVKSVGCVLNGLLREEVSSIPPEGIESLTPDIIPCLQRETLKSMTFTQLLHLSPSAVAAMTPEQKSALSGNQLKAVERAYEGNTKMADSDKSTADVAFCRTGTGMAIFHASAFAALPFFAGFAP